MARETHIAIVFVGVSLVLSSGLNSQTTGSATLPRVIDTDGTTSGTAIPEIDARRRLEAAGYRNVEGMTVDGSGIWRAFTITNGIRISVNVDAVGKVTVAAD